MSRLGGRSRNGLGVIAAVGVLLAVIVPGGATATQGQPAAGQEAKVQPLSVGCRATFSSGTGPNLLNVCVSDHGNLITFESPSGADHVVEEGYAVCSEGDPFIHGHDTGGVEGGFGPPTITQPTAGRFPLTVMRRTTNGVFELKQV